MAKFEKGRAKTGGRQKGTPNKATVIEQRLMDSLDSIEIESLIAKLAKEYPQALLGILSKFIPNRVNVGGQTDNELIIKIKGLGSGD